MAATLVQEDGTGKSTANSYNTAAGANSELEELYLLMGLTSAPTVTDVDCIAGTHYLEAVYGTKLMGYRTEEEQALSWPRVYVYTDAEKMYTYDSDEMPDSLLRAHALAAYYAANDSANIIPNKTAAGTIKREKKKAGPVEKEIEYLGGNSPYKTYTLIDQYMQKLCEVGTSVTRSA